MSAVYPLRCRIRAQADTTRIDVYDDIGEGGLFSDGITAKDFAASVAGAKGALEVHINSGGGDVFDGIAIGNAIRAYNGPVTTVVDGIAASIASVIAQAGRDRVMQPGSMMMIHDAFGACVGDAADMERFARTLNSVSDNIALIYAARTGRAADEWRAAMRAETWYDADAAVAEGLADKVGEGQAELPEGLDVAAFTAVPGRIAAQLRTLPRARSQPLLGLWARAHILNAAADESSWDGDAAMAAAGAADDPAAAFRAICAGRRSGDPKQRQTWALPHHKHPGDPPNRAGVSNAMGRLSGTQGLTNAAAARAHLQAHQKAMGSGSDGSNAAPSRLAWDPGAFEKTLRGETR